MKVHETGNVVMEIKHGSNGRTLICSDYILPPEHQNANMERIAEMYVCAVLRKDTLFKHGASYNITMTHRGT